VVTAPIRSKADERTVDSVLQSAAKGKREKIVKDKEVDWSEYGLDKPEFTITLKTKEKEYRIAFGAANPTKTSCYVRVNDDPQLLLVSDTFKNSLNKQLFDLRDKSVTGIAPDDIDRIVITAKDKKKIEIRREDAANWRMTEPESMKIKKSLVDANLRSLTGLTAKKIIDEPQKEGDPYGLDKPDAAVLMAGKKLDQTLLIGKAVEEEKKEAGPTPPPSPDRYASIKGRDTVYVISGMVFKNLQKDPEDLRDRSSVSFDQGQIEKVSIDFEGQSFEASLGKDNKWSLEKPKKRQIETWTVTSILWALKDLEWKSVNKDAADKLASLHLENPQLVVSLFKKGEKEPITLKVGWEQKQKKEEEKESKAPDKAASETKKREDQKKEGAETSAESVQESTPFKESDIPTSVNVLVQPHEEGPAVFVVDGNFIKRLRDDLKRLEEPQK
jgi:hypothetical protein